MRVALTSDAVVTSSGLVMGDVSSGALQIWSVLRQGHALCVFLLSTWGNVNAVFGVSLTRALETLIGAVPVTSNAGLGANHMAVLLAG